MSKYNYQIVLLDESSKEQQVDLYSRAFHKKDSPEELLMFWENKHYNNPVGKSLIFGVYIDGVLAGMNAFLPCIYEYDNVKSMCLQSCESAVDSRYQGRGIWGSIIKYAEEYIFSQTGYEVIIGFPNYRNSYPGFMKLGWTTKDSMNNYIMANNPYEFIDIYSSNKLVKFFAPILQLQKIVCFINKLFCQQITFEDASIDDISLNVDKAKFSIHVNRDWISWKFNYKKEHCFFIKYKGTKVASCIYMLDNFRGGKVIRIDRIDLMENANISFNQVLSASILYLSGKYRDAAFFRMWVQKGNKMNAALRCLAFIRSSHPNPFIIKTRNDDYLTFDWKLSFFDLD